jgi:hypothetical protein
MNTVLFAVIDLAGLAWLAFWLFQNQVSEIRKFYWPALIVKWGGGLAVGIIYFYHYGAGDTISYWMDGNTTADFLIQDPAGAIDFLWRGDELAQPGILNSAPRSLFFIKFVAFLSIICHGNYWVMSLVISFISFTAAWYLFKNLIKFFPQGQFAGAIAFLFFPSVVFWSSGIIKECLGLACIFFLAGVVIKYYGNLRPSLVEWIGVTLSLWIGWNLKYYWMGIFIPVCMTTIIVVFIIRWRPQVEPFQWVIWPLTLMILLIVATSVHPNFYPDRISEVIWQNNNDFMRLSSRDNVIVYRDFHPDLQSVLINSPQALIGCLFRPWVWEAHDGLSFVAGLENLFVLALVLISLFSLRKRKLTDYKLLTFSVIAYSILLAVFLALSTPNLGTLSRYKIGFLPFLVFLLLYENPLLNLNHTKK